MPVDFELDLAYVGETSQIQKGQLKIMGSNFHLSLPDQKMICDGKALYIILSDAKEVQILPLGDEGMTKLSPVDLLNQYCGNDFLSALQGKAKEDGKEVLHLEFTPVDKTEDLFKVRVSYLESQNEIYRIKTFSKDGSRMTLTATNYNFTESLPSHLFTFDEIQYQKYNIEDLR